MKTQAGEPVVKAAVLWYSYPKPRLSYAVDPPIMPRGHVLKATEREELIAKLTTDDTGRFESSAELDPGRYYPNSRLVVLALVPGSCPVM